VLADYSLDADDDDIAYGGRQVYGNYKKKNKPTVCTIPPTCCSKANSIQATNTAEGDQDETEAREMIKQSRPVKLSELNSISGGRRANSMAVNDKFQKKRKHK
jgi:hypothetical protein